VVNQSLQHFPADLRAFLAMPVLLPHILLRQILSHFRSAFPAPESF
jgi:hypothetical protein